MKNKDTQMLEEAYDSVQKQTQLDSKEVLAEGLVDHNIANRIVKALEARGESKDYIIGFLMEILNGMKQLYDMEDTELDVSKYLDNILMDVHG